MSPLGWWQQGLVQGDKQGPAPFWGVTGDSSVPVGKGETAMGSLTTADGQDVGVWLKGEAGGSRRAPFPGLPTGLSLQSSATGMPELGGHE